MAQKESYGLTSMEVTLTDDLFAGEFPRVQVPVTIAQGETAMVRGTILGKITVSGKYKAYSNAASDGTETALLVLGVDVAAASSGDVVAFAYTTGEFNKAKVVGLDAAGEADLLTRNIYMREVSS